MLFFKSQPINILEVLYILSSNKDIKDMDRLLLPIYNNAFSAFFFLYIYSLTKTCI